MPTLAELSITNTPRANDILTNMLRWSPLIRFLEERSAFVLDATTFDNYPEVSEGELQTRGIGQGYTTNGELPPDRETGDMGFQGDSLSIDRAHVRDHNEGLQPIGPWIDRRLPSKTKKWAKLVEKAIIQGDGTKGQNERTYTGWQTILDGASNVAPYNTTMVIDAVDFLSSNPNALDLTDPAHQEAFMRAMEEILAHFDNPGVVSNRQVASMLGSMARDRKRFGNDYDSFGNKVEQIDGNRIVRLNDGSITNTEPDNAGTANLNTTSTYICSAEPGLFSFKTHGLEVEDELDEILEEVRSGKIEWELRGDNVIEDRYALWRIRNIKVPGGSSDYMDLA